MSFARRILAFINFAIFASFKAISLNGDLIFATSTPLTIAFPALAAKYFRRKPLVFEVRDLWPELPIAMGAIKNKHLQKMLYRFERFVYLNSSQIIACSPGMKAGIEATGVNSELITVIPNSCDNDTFYPDDKLAQIFRKKYDWLQDRPLVVYTGTHGLINGVGYFAHLATEVAKIDSNICFLTVGDGAEWGKVREIAIQNTIFEKNFFMLGSVPKLEIPYILAAATVASSLFIDLPEMWSNSANKFFDGLASGTPVMINYQGWQADLLKESKAGLVLSANDVANAAQVLVKHINDPSWVAETGKLARELAVEKFDRDKLADDFEGVLNQAI